MYAQCVGPDPRLLCQCEALQSCHASGKEYVQMTYTYVCMHCKTSIVLYVYVYMCMYTHICTYAYVHTCIHTYMHACVHAYIHTHMYTQFPNYCGAQVEWPYCTVSYMTACSTVVWVSMATGSCFLRNTVWVYRSWSQDLRTVAYMVRASSNKMFCKGVVFALPGNALSQTAP